MTNCWQAGVPLEWEQPCISYSVLQGGVPSAGLDEAQTLTSVAAAFSLWPTVACGEAFPSIAIQSTPVISCGEPEYNPEGPNANAVIFRERAWPHDAVLLGLTTVSFDVNTGKILDADLEVNAANYVLTPLGLEYVIAHEAGHFLGFDHSNDSEALMSSHYSPFGVDAPPELTNDDQQAICAAYPPDRVTSASCDPEPEYGFAPECGGDVHGGCDITWRRNASSTIAWLGCAALALAFRRLKRRAHPEPQRS